MSSCSLLIVFFVFKQKTAYELRISDWSPDVRSSDLQPVSTLGFLDRKKRLRGIDDLPADSIGSYFVAALLSCDQFRNQLVVWREPRSEEGRVGKECVSTCRSRWASCNTKKKKCSAREYIVISE